MSNGTQSTWQFNMSRYLVDHYTVTPENYQVYRSFERKIKALYIPSGSTFPKIFYDTPEKIKSESFDSNAEIHFVPLHPYYHMYVDSVSQMESLNHNVVATYLFRYSLLTMIGFETTQNIYGNAVIFGSVSTKDQSLHETDYSVPYEIVEQVSRLYDYRVVK